MQENRLDAHTWEQMREETAVLARAAGVEPSNEAWTFYYDETGNYRRISYKNDRVPDERSVSRNFILGGLVFTCKEADSRVLEKASSLPSPQGEIKSKSVLGGSKDLVRTLSRTEVSRFLEILSDHEILVHYSAQNNLYLATVDIVDSLLALDDYRCFAPLHRALKDQLYACASVDPKGFLDFVRRYGYPNVTGDDIGPFCLFLEDLVRLGLDVFDRYRDSTAGFVAELLREMLHNASSSDELVFLVGNPDKELVGGFLHNYTLGCLMFPKSQHVFDTEETIVARIGAKANNYEFVDSKSCVPIQLSDVLVGLIARVFSFFDGLHPRELEFQRSRIRGKARANLRAIRNLIDRSNEASPLLIHNINADTDLALRQFYFDALCD